MYSGKNKLLLIGVLLLFVMQTVAAVTVPYTMQTQKQSSNSLMEGLGHSSHCLEQIIEKTNTTVPQCCESIDNCTIYCNMGSCFSAVLPAVLTLQGIVSSNKISCPDFFAASQPPTSFYRPPIMC